MREIETCCETCGEELCECGDEVKESSNLSRMIRGLVMDTLQEFDYANGHVYDSESYSDPFKAYKDFMAANPLVKKTKRVEKSQLRTFLLNVYQGGEHQVSAKDFLKCFVKRGITVADRRDTMDRSGYKKKMEHLKPEIKKMIKEMI